MSPRLHISPRLSFVRIGVGLVIAALIGLLLGSVVLADFAIQRRRGVKPAMRTETLLARQFARGPGAASRFVQIPAADHAVLGAWLFTPPHPNRSAAILLHGVGDTWLGVTGQARFLLDAGYTVLAPDSRGHGESGGQLVTYGLLEAEDMHRWVDFVLRQPGIDRVYGAGQSMGAAILIQSIARKSRFHAIVADCPFANFEEIAFDRMVQFGSPNRLLAWPVVEFGLVYGHVRYGVDLRNASPATALRSSHTPVLLIHGTADSNIPIRHSRELHQINPAITELWEVPGAEHVQCVSRAPEEYARRVTMFFAAHL